MPAANPALPRSLPVSELKRQAIEKLLRYVKIDTQSSESSQTSPSTQKQFDLARLLVDELHALGLADAAVDKHCQVMATLPATPGVQAPAIGLMAHLDTSPELPGGKVQPQIIADYRGGDIVLNAAGSVVIRESENPELALAIGHTLVTTNGATLLGSDDKAGITAIMTAVEFLVRNPAIPHGTVRIAFTPDEEIGKGVEHFDIGKFGASFACTVDGGFTGELNNETFSADKAVITVAGRDMHPGSAKDRMVSSIRAMAKIIAMLPAEMSPERTSGHEPFMHPVALEGSTGTTTLKLLLRDFTQDGLNCQKRMIEEIIAEAKKQFPGATFDLQVTPTYRNMKPELQKHPQVLARLEEAVALSGVRPVWKPIRGGTDGAVLTARGLPTPNLFTASCNAHSLTEWQDIDGLVKAVETLCRLVVVCQ